MLILAVILINAIFGALGEKVQLKYDLTENAIYKLDRQSISLLESLDKKINIYIMAVRRNFTGSAYLTQAYNILEQYPRYSANLSLTFVDYAADPTFAAGFPGRQLEVGSILVVGDDGIRQLKLADLFNFTLSRDGASMVIGSSRAEEAITGAIMEIVTGEVVRAALLVGNGAKKPAAFLSMLKDNNYDVVEINPFAAEIPDDASVVFLFGPGTDYTEYEIDKIDDFLYNNGNYGKTLFYTADSSSPTLPRLESYLAEWGVSVEDGAVYETSAERTYQYIPFYPVADYSDRLYKDMLYDARSTFLMPMARQIRILYEFRDANSTEMLLEFGASTVVRPSDAPADFTAEDAAVRGPLPALALASKRTAADGAALSRSNVIVSASTEMLDEKFIKNPSLTNGEYLLNLVNSLAKTNSTPKITPKSFAGRNLSIPTSAASTLGIILAGLAPACVFAFGAAVWLHRRNG